MVSMHHGQLRNSLSHIKEKELRKTLTGTLRALLDDMPTDDGFETLSNVTTFTNPPLPKTEVPANPCKGLGFRRKPLGDKCALSSNPMCYKLLAISTSVIHYCMGGLEVDVHSACLNKLGQAITGLYDAGKVADGVHGDNRLGGNWLLGRVSGSHDANGI